MIPSRVILGFAVGGASVTVPVYLSELAPTERRGSLAGRGELAIVIGQLLAFAINAIIGTVWGEHPGVWRYMLAVAAIPAIALFVGMLQMPESPRWLISKDRHDEALAVLLQVRSEERARAEMEEVEFLAAEEKEAHLGGWSDLTVPWIRRIFIAGIGVAIAQQCTGINSIMYYGTQVLTRAGFSASAALIANVANGVLAVVGSTICLFFLMDRVPRRKLIIGGFIATTTAHALIVLSAFLLPEGLTKAFVILFFMVTFVFCMQLALNIPVWVIISEMFPLRLRGLGMGVCVLCLWVANAIIAFLFPIVVEAIGIEGAFLVFVVLGLIAIAFLKVFLPETKDRSLEELEERFAAGQFKYLDARPLSGRRAIGVSRRIPRVCRLIHVPARPAVPLLDRRIIRAVRDQFDTQETTMCYATMLTGHQPTSAARWLVALGTLVAGSGRLSMSHAPAQPSRGSTSRQNRSGSGGAAAIPPSSLSEIRWSP